MGVPPLPGIRALPRAADAEYAKFQRYARALGSFGRGHHNLNYMVRPLTGYSNLVGVEEGQPVTVRLPIPSALPVVIRTWEDEGAVLNSIRRYLPHVPQCLVKREGMTILSYVEGVPLSSICPNGKRVDSDLVSALAGLFADMAQVPRQHLPPLPLFWPRSSKNSKAYLRTLAAAAEEQIRRRNWGRFGGLFAMLGIPEDAMTQFAERVPPLIRRPFSLLHTDLHRDNVIVSYHGDPPLICVDWELASYGDPLHDLATHLIRMQYPTDQWQAVIGAWRETMDRRNSSAVEGLDRDLQHYLAFERAQSVYPDVMRAATSLADSSGQQRDLDAATNAVYEALRVAEEPLRLKKVPDKSEIERVLFRWNESHGGQTGQERPIVPVGWKHDPRVPPHPEFPAEAVSQALFLEGAAPADRVFKGTAHLNTAVEVPGIPFPVMVRRKVGAANPRERRFLNEHAVLRAIERSRVAVRAPRVLALGTSGLDEPFTIHSYEGSTDGVTPPRHPENGLRPQEADDLVAQLCELSKVDYTELEQIHDQDFYWELQYELVRMVDDLPKATLGVARELGLPSSHRLMEILGRHAVVLRRPALLHGDLNPWNLVRRADGGLTLIDWEMAMIGDPLYDLVRHMRLTPTSSEIRERMFRRWSRSLPEECTKGWADDWRVYRWMEIVRSAYVDLDRLVTADSLEAPNVRRAVDTYSRTLADATAALGLPGRPTRPANPYLARAFMRRDDGEAQTAGVSADV
ncbi:aminoglycoside phosphotransferase (APT) family kinase protein [Streptomyces canus]|uniref:aminoglycoside phosphotransferase family protein n=1 Tax=Streptomyces canus TaxID=58343 RepID=UPI002786C864|nr:aminoglycoside phosphotransferase family protein [Streptomyces canus]MDQ0600776.1 aminoglycoside phosphotransferase (APT) family kinase protein [Streptomyces canus]